MNNINLIATTNFGLEAVTKRELLDLGFQDLKVSDGKVEIGTDFSKIPLLNINVRSAERILLEVGNFKALTFEELFDKTFDINWGEILPEDAKFIVEGRSVKSKLFSISDCQRIVEKAIVEKLKLKYKKSWFEKTGSRYKIEVSLLKDIASITIDTSGDGLHKRGYREKASRAPLSETIAASLVMLSYWNKDRLLMDPFCGSGTIPIEAAMIGKNIAPGINRKFDSENWGIISSEHWKNTRREAFEKIDYDVKLNILASDISWKAIGIAKENAEILGLEEDIRFFAKDVRDLVVADDYGVLITNPPYGVRIGEVEDSRELNKELGKLFKNLETWSKYVITGEENFERDFGEKASRKRKLYNGRLKVYYYQYLGPPPNKKINSKTKKQKNK